METVALNKRLALSLFLLRISVFIVMLMWTLDKFFNPEHGAAVFEKFYLISGLGNIAVYSIGTVQLAIVLAFVTGYQKKISYLLVLFMHSVSTFSSFKVYLTPLEVPNLLFFAAWPMLAACFTLYYLKDFDTKWSL
ncbi:DoxX family membrane protein [Roseofilum casamattae]|uniref:DoxX family membrane protein n=1 Tax=Roseofilum casamattae BLCC-M143 TaxID=3022442 RepID=A0ABT7BYY0_9CYAN|nr:DoxX family membrane protein [Roseofilum casamattae]MDJ1183997.1 DoxX family membrane protein [Roseofilum casamattae BLCC-M143]